MKKHAALFLVAALLLYGCNIGSFYRSSCETSPDPPCPTNETCPDPCVPLPPPGWSFPVLLWSGPELEAPECPVDRADTVQFEGYADPIESSECPTCSCEPSTGECELPSILTASTQACGILDPAPIFYDYSGLSSDPMICNTTNALPEDLIYSLTIGPLPMTESGCKPVTTVTPRSGAASWNTFARACGSVDSPCQDPGTFCASTAPPASGFSRCVYQQGEHECPSDYPDRRVFYDGISDSRRCSECSCGVPEDGECTGHVKLYRDPTCAQWVSWHWVTSEVSFVSCIDIPTGDALLGKTATTPVYEPGTCEPNGGEPIGSVELLRPSTFCCQ